MRIVRAGSDGQAYARLSDGCNWPAFLKLPCSRLGRSYYAAIRGTDHVDDSFVIEEAGRAVAHVMCDAHAGSLEHLGHPIEVLIAPDAAPAVQRNAMRTLLSEITRLAALRQAPTQRIRTSHLSTPAGLIESQLLHAGAACRPEHRVEADLALGDAALLDDLRKGHRQQVRWGQKNLRLQAIDAAAPDAELFDRFRTFHAEVAGRVTRPRESWDAMYAFIRAGAGDAIFSWLGDELVGATLTLDAGGTAYYASGVYHRGHFDKPLGHYPLYTAMCRARARGARLYDVGEVPMPGGTASEKELSIGYFKRGFASRVVNSLIWTLGQ